MRQVQPVNGIDESRTNAARRNAVSDCRAAAVFKSLIDSPVSILESIQPMSLSFDSRERGM